MSIVALVDCNSFYASCETIFKPHLNKKPIVVLSNNDGCVIARSSEAKSRDIVIAIFEGNLTVKRLVIRTDGSAILKAENPLYKNILISEYAELEIWGVVTSAIHQFIK